MGFLRHLEVDNFKSWRGRQVIGPFVRFNCIIGTNGSGKSNVMDALGFVLGERASSLRVKHLRELIYGAHVGRPGARTASVSLSYCLDGGGDLVFRRSISGDSSEYYVNGMHVTLNKYKEELEKISIVVEARNCLVFQGEVESIAMKDPKKRTKMFERISQSSEYAADYEKKREALQKAKDDAQYHFNKKKTASAERKQVSQEKQRAQKYQALKDDLDQSRLQLFLFQLYHNGRSITTLSATLSERQQGAALKKNSLEEREQDIKAHKKEHGRLTREQQHIEKAIRTEEQTLSHHQPQYIKAKVNTSHHQKKAEDARMALKKGQRLRAAKEQDLEDIRREIEELYEAWRSYERGMREKQAASRDIELEQNQMEQYKELKEAARKQGAVLSQQAEKLHWEVLANSEKIAFDRRRKKEVEINIKNHQIQLEDFTQRAVKLEEYTNSCSASLEEYRRQGEALSEELQQGGQRTMEVNQELDLLLQELGNARLDRFESRRQQQREEVMQMLHRLYPNTVYGRLVDLCSPIHKKYQLPVTKVFGSYMNAIVVASEKVSRDCIRHLKEERAEPETFLPIDYLVVKPLNERLREVRGAKLVVDVIQCNAGVLSAQLKKVVQFVCGNAMVCESIEQARRVAYDGPERIKTVAQDGTLFSKSGVISGGSSDLRTKARRWDQKDMKQLKDRKEDLTTELRGLMMLNRKESELKQIQVQAQGAQTRLKYSSSELENLRRKKIPSCKAEISHIECELANLESCIKMQQESMEANEAETRRMTDRIDQMEDLVFADFCAEIGVANIRDYEQGHLKQRSELDKKRLEFESQHGRLTAQLEYEQEQTEQHNKKLRKLEQTIAKEESTVAEQRKEEERILEAVEESQNKVLDLKKLLLAKKSQVGDFKSKLDQKNKILQEKNRELVMLQREVLSVESALEQRRLAKHNLLLDCKIQGLPLNLLSGSLNDISEVQLDSESTSSTTDIYDIEARLVIDYSELGANVMLLEEEQEVEAHERMLREAVSSVGEVLHNTSTPNLKAVEKMREVKEKFKDVSEAFDVSTRAVRKCGLEFQKVKAQRFHRFNKCFEHVSIVIDQIYKRLCRNSSAQAILSAENPDEPYLGGIVYNCVAPGKRFMAMDNLSGGEKAIAALVLVFAIHSFRPAPFLVLDEVDAALDNSNIGKVTRFIREGSREGMQIIVISLKGEFYCRSEALLGVYPEFDECMYSRMLTLDLRPYPLNEDHNGQEALEGSGGPWEP